MIRYRETVLPLAKVSEAIVETIRSRSSNRGKLMSRPSLVIAEGDTTRIHPITDIYSGGDNAEAIVRIINGWLTRNA